MRRGAGLRITHFFRPDVASASIFAHEALVLGPNGEGAFTILSAVDDASRYMFDQQCRVKAIEMAAHLHLPADGASLSINFMPNAVYEPRACIRLTLDAAKRTGFPLDRIIFEFTESEKLDTAHLLNIPGDVQGDPVQGQRSMTSAPVTPGCCFSADFSRTSSRSTWI